MNIRKRKSFQSLLDSRAIVIPSVVNLVPETYLKSVKIPTTISTRLRQENMIKQPECTLYYILTMLIIFCHNVLHADAGITTYLRDTGVIPAVPMSEMTETATNVPEMARIFYSAIGDLVETVPIFPITFNVPDMVTAFGGLLSGMYNYITGNTNSGGSEPKDVLGAMVDIYRHIAVQEDIHDFEFMT